MRAIPPRARRMPTQVCVARYRVCVDSAGIAQIPLAVGPAPIAGRAPNRESGCGSTLLVFASFPLALLPLAAQFFRRWRWSPARADGFAGQDIDGSSEVTGIEMPDERYYITAGGAFSTVKDAFFGVDAKPVHATAYRAWTVLVGAASTKMDATARNFVLDRD